jgi:hypothetical protein
MMGRGWLFCAGRSVTGAVADALPPITKDAPAAPKTGNVLARFRFEACFACAFLAFAIVEPPVAASDVDK